MSTEKEKINLKIFSIDKTHIDLRGKSFESIVEIITKNHKLSLKAENKDLDSSKKLVPYKEDKFNFYSYTFNREKENYYWINFLPKELTSKHNFNVTEFSYVLFIEYNKKIYCIIGGSGVSVIRKYIDSNFGIDFYQHFAKPKEDLLIDLSMRSISGNISQKKNTYNKNQTVSESFNYSEIPQKLKIYARDEVKNEILKNFIKGEKNPILEIGNYFSIRKKINYTFLKQLIIDIDYITSNKDTYHELTLFKRIKDIDLVDELELELLRLVIDDVLSLNTGYSHKLVGADIIELVHPTQLEKYYECNSFEIKFPRQNKTRKTYNRSDLYFESIKFIFENCEDTYSRFEIEQKVKKLKIDGYNLNELLTFETFMMHLTCEIPFKEKKYFKIDKNWYLLTDKYLEQITNDAVQYYTDLKLTAKLLNPWKEGDDEDTYNKSHEDLSNYYIFDKKYVQNIELCDILAIVDSKIYFIHVKNHFYTSMRDLYVQVVLSAKRLWNDLNNNEKISYLEDTFEYYNNSKGIKNKIDTENIIRKIKNKELKIHFIMAYNNTSYKGKNAIDKIKASSSNIAKYSLLQSAKEMKEFVNFEYSMIDISELKEKL